MKNILESFLDALEVRYTRRFARHLYDEHPHRDNMYGLKRMLDVYGVKMLGVYMADKDFKHLTYPCILHVPNDFIIGLEHEEGHIKCVSHGENIEMPIEMFKETWTGNALVIEEAISPREPDFKKHQYEQLQFWCKMFSVPAILSIITVACWVRNMPYYTWLHYVYILLGILGIVICSMLLQKQLFGKSRYGDRVCTIFHHADCNSILDGTHAKCFGISWSEIGMGYFLANIFLLSVLPVSIYSVAIICWAAMCFAVWSIYFQWRVAHSWCVLCVLVQVLVWMQGFASVVMYVNRPIFLEFSVCMLSCLVFAVCIMSVHQCTSFYMSEKERAHSEQQYRALKANKIVAQALIEANEYYEVTTDDSSILLGNPSAKIRVTILSNPHCNPCAQAHEHIEHLLDVCGDDICVQYIFTYFNPEIEDSCRYLISCYDANDIASARKHYTNWYQKDKYNYKKLTKQNSGKLRMAKIDAELDKHLSWRRKTGITETPTIFVNGYVLPRIFSIEDLSMVVGMDFPVGYNFFKTIDSEKVAAETLRRQPSDD